LQRAGLPLLADKKITVLFVVIDACPMRQTSLASGRLGKDDGNEELFAFFAGSRNRSRAALLTCQPD